MGTLYSTYAGMCNQSFLEKLVLEEEPQLHVVVLSDELLCQRENSAQHQGSTTGAVCSCPHIWGLKGASLCAPPRNKYVEWPISTDDFQTQICLVGLALLFISCHFFSLLCGPEHPIP